MLACFVFTIYLEVYIVNTKHHNVHKLCNCNNIITSNRNESKSFFSKDAKKNLPMDAFHLALFIFTVYLPLFKTSLNLNMS